MGDIDLSTFSYAELREAATAKEAERLQEIDSELRGILVRQAALKAERDLIQGKPLRSKPGPKAGSKRTKRVNGATDGAGVANAN